MGKASDDDERRLLRLRAEAGDRERELHVSHEREQRHADALIARLRREAVVREHDLGELRQRLAAAESELEDLRAIATR